MCITCYELSLIENLVLVNLPINLGNTLFIGALYRS